MKLAALALLILSLLAPTYPTVDRFVVSFADCHGAMMQWDERTPEMNVYEDVYFQFTTWNETRIYQGEYLNFTHPEWWWTPFSDDQGRTWAVSGYALTDIGRVDTFNHLEINCINKAYAPFVGG